MSALHRPALDAVALYAPDARPVPVDLSDNVNLWGLPPAARRALADLAAARPAVYPPAVPAELCALLASYAGVRPEQVVTGCGSDDVIDCALRAFAREGQRVAFCAPTFSMVPNFSKVNGLEPVGVPFRRDGDVDVEALLAVDAPITYVCAPNNPTGWPVSDEALRAVVTRARGLVLVDEAYAEFSGTSAIPLLAGAPNLLVTRTLSKAFGLAGLRVGYGLGARPLVEALEKVRGPYKVNALGLHAAIAVLREDQDWMRRHVTLAVELRERLEGELRARGLAPLRSAANFLCVPVPDAAALAGLLLGRGVRVRALRDLPGIGDAIRIGVGPWEQLEALLAALDDITGRAPERAEAS